MSRAAPPSLAQGIAAALALSLAGAALLTTLALGIGSATALRVVVAALGLAYLLYVLAQSGRRAGRVTAVAAWMLAAALAWLSAPSLGIYVLLHVGMLWLVRSVYFHSSPLSALADLGLSALATAFAVWAALRSGSAALALWCFFLVQAFFVAIPPDVGRHAKDRSGPGADDEAAFERAHRAAETALRRLGAGR